MVQHLIQEKVTVATVTLALVVYGITSALAANYATGSSLDIARKNGERPAVSASQKMMKPAVSGEAVRLQKPDTKVKVGVPLTSAPAEKREVSREEMVKKMAQQINSGAMRTPQNPEVMRYVMEKMKTAMENQRAAVDKLSCDDKIALRKAMMRTERAFLRERGISVLSEDQIALIEKNMTPEKCEMKSASGATAVVRGENIKR